MPYNFCEKIGNEIRDISDEIPFEIPDSWEWVRLKTVCTKLVDGTHNPPKGEINKTDYLMISSTNINNDRIENLDKIRYLNKEVFVRENLRTQATKGDIFFTSVGSLGRSCVYKGNYNLTFQRSVSVLTTLIFNYFLKYCFDSAYFQLKIQKEATGTAQKGFYLNQLSDCLIPIPPLAEQHRIVAKIEELMPCIEKYEQTEKQLTKLNETFPEMLKKSILQQAVQGKLVPQNPDDEPASILLERIRAEKQSLIKAGKIKNDKHESVIITRDKIPYEITDGKERCIADEVPFDIPDSWCWCRWGDLSESIQYGYNAPAKENGRIKMVRISDIQGNKVLWDSVPYCDIDEDIIENYLLKPNDILFARTGGTVGKSYLVKDVPEKAIYAGYLIRTRYSDSLCPEYLKYFMQSELYWIQLRNGTIATAQPNCNGKTLANMLVPLPPLSEQKRIVAKIEEVIQHCNKL